jgi:hypothetical protein
MGIADAARFLRHGLSSGICFSSRSSAVVSGRNGRTKIAVHTASQMRRGEDHNQAGWLGFTSAGLPYSAESDTTPGWHGAPVERGGFDAQGHVRWPVNIGPHCIRRRCQSAAFLFAVSGLGFTFRVPGFGRLHSCRTLPLNCTPRRSVHSC